MLVLKTITLQLNNFYSICKSNIPYMNYIANFVSLVNPSKMKCYQFYLGELVYTKSNFSGGALNFRGKLNTLKRAPATRHA